MVQEIAGQSGVPTRIERAEEPRNLVGGHPAVHRLIFCQITDPAPEFHRPDGGIQSEHFDGPGLRAQQPEQCSDQGRLACTVTAEQRKRLPRGISSETSSRTDCLP